MNKITHTRETLERELKKRLETHGELTHFQFDKEETLSTGLFYFWRCVWSGETLHIRAEAESYRLDKEVHSVHFSDNGGFRWYLHDQKDLVEIE